MPRPREVKFSYPDHLELSKALRCIRARCAEPADGDAWLQMPLGLTPNQVLREAGYTDAQVRWLTDRIRAGGVARRIGGAGPKMRYEVRTGPETVSERMAESWSESLRTVNRESMRRAAKSKKSKSNPKKPTPKKESVTMTTPNIESILQTQAKIENLVPQLIEKNGDLKQQVADLNGKIGQLNSELQSLREQLDAANQRIAEMEASAELGDTGSNADALLADLEAALQE